MIAIIFSTLGLRGYIYFFEVSVTTIGYFTGNILILILEIFMRMLLLEFQVLVCELLGVLFVLNFKCFQDLNSPHKFGFWHELSLAWNCMRMNSRDGRQLLFNASNLV